MVPLLNYHTKHLILGEKKGFKEVENNYKCKTFFTDFPKESESKQ